MLRIQPLWILLFIVLYSCDRTGKTLPEKVRTGAEMLIENHLQELEGKRVGLVMNPTARIGQTHMLDTLMALGVNVKALFAPEHGFRGEAGAGEIIEDGVDQATGLPVYSLYGETRSPTREMLQTADLLLFDMQDVGARFYTYNSTLGLLIWEASKQQIPVWILDRPNPAGGDYVSGWILEEEHKSFVGMYPIPIAHGMTLGELAQMMIGEQWLEFDNEPEVRVIEMSGWNRSMKWPETGLDWTPPSPNLPTFEHAYAYLGTCLTEGTSLSEGRGTPDPFLILGSPQTSIAAEKLERLNQLPGLELELIRFTPESIPGKALNPKHEGKECTGLRMRITDFQKYDPVTSGLILLKELMNSTGQSETLPFIKRLAGTGQIEAFLNDSVNQSKPQFMLNDFIERRKKYLIYD